MATDRRGRIETCKWAFTTDIRTADAMKLQQSLLLFKQLKHEVSNLCPRSQGTEVPSSEACCVSMAVFLFRIFLKTKTLRCFRCGVCLFFLLLWRVFVFFRNFFKHYKQRATIKCYRMLNAIIVSDAPNIKCYRILNANVYIPLKGLKRSSFLALKRSSAQAFNIAAA